MQEVLTLKKAMTVELNALRKVAVNKAAPDAERESADIQVKALQTVLGRADQKRNGPNVEISDKMVLEVLNPLVKDLKDLASKLEGVVGKEAELQKLVTELKVLSKYLPKLADESEVLAFIDEQVAAVPAESRTAALQGAVMQALTAKFGKGQFDGKVASSYLRSKLS